MNEMSEEYPETASKILDSCNAMTENMLMTQQQMLESCARNEVYFEQIMSRLSKLDVELNPEPVVPISNQTQESHPVHQVNQTLMSQDFTINFEKNSESVQPLFHWDQFDEFESEGNCEKDQEDESVHEDETLVQPLCDDVINPSFEKCKLHESSNNQSFDIFDEDCIYLEDLFEEIVEKHTKCFENADINGDDACMNDNFLLNEIIGEDKLNDSCKNITVEEHECTPKHVEKIKRIPFGRKPLDLSNFTFDEQLNKNFFDDNVNANDCGGIIENKRKNGIEAKRKSLDLSLFTFEEPIINQSFDDNVNINKFEDIIEEEKLRREEWNEIICENLFEDDDEEFVRRRMNHRRRRLRRRKTKMERGLAKLTKRLSSTNSPVKRTHWNDGDRARGFRPKHNFCGYLLYIIFLSLFLFLESLFYFFIFLSRNVFFSIY
jgi:hypothetical protein